jgi:hypothetical protein
MQTITFGLLALGLVAASLGFYRAGGLLLAGSVGAVFLWRLLGPRGRLEFFSVRSRWIDLLTIGALFGVLVFFSVLAR